MRMLGTFLAVCGVLAAQSAQAPNPTQRPMPVNAGDTMPIYRVTVVGLKGNRAVSYRPFAEGWLQGSRAWGRPVDVLVMPDGALLVSDDEAGAIYRISYKK